MRVRVMKKYKETFIVKSQFSDGLRTFPKGTIFESTGVFLGIETLFCVYYPDGVPYACLHDGNSAQIMLLNRTPLTLAEIRAQGDCHWWVRNSDIDEYFIPKSSLEWE